MLTEVANNKDAIDSLRTELNDRFTSVESRIEELVKDITRLSLRRRVSLPAMVPHVTRFCCALL